MLIFNGDIAFSNLDIYLVICIEKENLEGFLSAAQKN